jgi:hypothetical protein
MGRLPAALLLEGLEGQPLISVAIMDRVLEAAVPVLQMSQQHQVKKMGSFPCRVVLRVVAEEIIPGPPAADPLLEVTEV